MMIFKAKVFLVLSQFFSKLRLSECVFLMTCYLACYQSLCHSYSFFLNSQCILICTLQASILALKYFFSNFAQNSSKTTIQTLKMNNYLCNLSTYFSKLFQQHVLICALQPTILVILINKMENYQLIREAAFYFNKRLGVRFAGVSVILCMSFHS